MPYFANVGPFHGPGASHVYNTVFARVFRVSIFEISDFSNEPVATMTELNDIITLYTANSGTLRCVKYMHMIAARFRTRTTISILYVVRIYRYIILHII